jgi:hypothetical protein
VNMVGKTEMMYTPASDDYYTGNTIAVNDMKVKCYIT